MPTPALIHRVKLKNLLSFGPDGIDIELRNLNVLIGPNGSGKSNFIEALGLVKELPRDLRGAIREGGGIGDWLWRGPEQASTTATIDITSSFFTPVRKGFLRHSFDLSGDRRGANYELRDEHIEYAPTLKQLGSSPQVVYENHGRDPILHLGDTKRVFKPGTIDNDQSILKQLQDPDIPELSTLARYYSSIGIHTDWIFGRYSQARQAQKTDLRNDHLESDNANLALVLNRIKGDHFYKRRLTQLMQRFMEGLDDLDVQIEGGRAQLFLQMGRSSIPATRVSDGTLRFLWLLAILVIPSSDHLVLCIDEPELGLHPDAIVAIGDLLIERAETWQLIVTTHSRILADALNDRAEDVIVCERHNDGTQMRRLEKREMGKWLQKYSLSELWSSGQIGGNRW